VPTLDGHLENVWAETADAVDATAAAETLLDAPTVDLPSAPDQLVTVFEEPDRPQPRLDRNADRGMGVAVGGLRESATGLQFNCLAHNTIRGAAGASLLNGELLRREGYL
jgi:aspartate-semialdehyde dehydrogenase